MSTPDKWEAADWAELSAAMKHWDKAVAILRLAHDNDDSKVVQELAKILRRFDNDDLSIVAASALILHARE